VRIHYFTLHTPTRWTESSSKTRELPQPEYNLDVGSGRADRTIASTPVPGDYKNTGTPDMYWKAVLVQKITDDGILAVSLV
jgi:hypothetical protein